MKKWQKELLDNPPKRMINMWGEDEWRHMVLHELFEVGNLSGEASPNWGHKHTEATKQLMSKNHGRYWKGKKMPDWVISNIVKARKGNPNCMHTKEWKKKMSDLHSGKGNPFYGKKHDPETKKKCGHQKNCRKVEFNGIIYNSCKEAAKAHNRARSFITRMIAEGKAKLL